MSYLYDADGNRIRLTFPDNNFFTYAYDQLDRETGILQAGTTNLLSITYDQLGRRSSLARTGAGKTTYAYDNASRLQNLTDQLGTAAGGANDQALTFSYYTSYQIKTKIASNSAYSWSGAASINRPYTINGLNQYTAAGGATFAYDPNGNLTQSSSSFFCYDTENRLIGEGASATDCSSLAVLTYDPLGRLVTTEAGGTTTRLVYDGDDLVAEYNSAGTLLRRYLHGPGTDDPLVQYEGATVAPTVERLLYSDAQGSIIAATDNAGNLMAGSIDRYDEYGIPLTDAAGHSLNSGRFQYTGQQWIGEVGMYYYKARFYSPTLGRFMQTDPVGYKDQDNLYEYVGDDPIDEDDATGLGFGLDDAAAILVGGAIGAGVAEVENGGHATAGQLAGGFVSGAVTGDALINIPETAGASTLAIVGGGSAAAGNVVQQMIDRGSVDRRSFVAATATGAVTGAVGARLPALRIPGLSRGRNSFLAVGKAARSRIQSGFARRMSLKTALKSAAGHEAAESLRTAFGAAVEKAKEYTLRALHLCDSPCK